LAVLSLPGVTGARAAIADRAFAGKLDAGIAFVNIASARTRVLRSSRYGPGALHFRMAGRILR
jgi:hypothetical protein